MSPELDFRRLAELQELLGADVATIVATLLDELDRAIAEVDTGLADGDLHAVALAAHSARNSALMIDARPLLGALAALEAGARAPDPGQTRTARDALLQAWEPLRTELVHAT